ncbi:MAG: MmgE/PrpD family protein [Burkholderiales bacterium]|nr:MmgE/PrpD family protein [Burkholderiales bacterium]
MTQTLSGRLAHFTRECRIGSIPPQVLARAKMFVLDYLGVALTASSARSSRIMGNVVAELGGRESCTVIGREYRTNALLAALANGTTGHAVEMDDDHRTSVLHPAVAVVPAALAMAEATKAGGAAVIEAVVAGYEAMTRIGDAFLGTQYYEGFHPTGTCGVFGAAAAAGRILNLSTEQLIAAFGIAGTQAAGLEEWKADGSWIKRLHPGKAAEGGVLAALLAKSSYTGPATILEGENGFLKAFSFERKWDVSKIVDGLGTEYRGYGTSFKPYAGCRFFHQVIDATLDLVREHKIDAAAVEEVTVRVYRTAYLTLFQPEARRRRPETVVDAQFSIPYAVAVSIAHGAPMPAHFTDERIREPALLDLAAKVKGIPDEEYESKYPARFPTQVSIRLKSGKTVEAFRDLPKGDPENPIYATAGRFEQEMVEKFRALLKLQPGYAERCDEMVAKLSALEAVSDVSGLLALFTPNARKGTR